MRRSLSDTADILAKKRRHKLWLKIVGVLGCAVVFVTTYALILPAITLEKQVICGLEEHVHSDACYTVPEPVTHSELFCSLDRLGIHVHSADCYGPDGLPVCGYADYVVHWHTADCYDENGVLVCPLPEIYLHTHTDECYGEAVPEGHVHGESCYETTRELVCELEESEGHAHGEACYDETGALVCALEESESHFHTDSCYEQHETLICGQEEAEQTGTARELTCRIPEVRLHTHTDACYDGGVLICGLPETYEHFHTEACFHVTQEQPEPELTCGLEEHTHTDDCYAPEEPESNSDPTADVETQAQWEATLQDVRLTHDYRLDVLAVARSQLGYTESARNYILDASGVPNGYTRYGAWYGDPYGDWCAMFVSFCLHYAELPEAVLPYESGCENWVTLLSQRQNYFEAHPKQPEDPAEPALAPYIPVPGDLIFFSMESGGIPDHVGLVTEYLPATDTEPARVRAIEGNTADAVRQTEYEWADTRILGYAQLPEQEFICGKTGHVHTDACPADCPIEEHIHTDVCFDASQAQQLTELSYTGDGFSVLVRYGADAQLPEGVTLTAREIAPDTPAYRTYCERSLASIQAADEDVPQTLLFARFLDISFVLNGVEYEPAAPVEVTIIYDESVDTGNATDCRAVHFGQNGTELLDVTTEQTQTGETSFTHMQDGFSVVGSVVTATYAAGNPTDIGPNKLPVDYYVCIDGEWVCVGSTRTGRYYTWNASEDLTNYNRDYITLEQAVSILRPYGFSGSAENPSRVTAYQQKSDNTNIYSDTDTVQIPENSENGTKILPLSRNASHAGYNLYYLPANTATISGLASPENLDKTANAFYTVKVYDAVGGLLTSEIVPTGGSFSYDVSKINVTSWIAAYSSGSTAELTGSVISLTDITSAVTISPKPAGAGGTGSHSVTFKAYIDNQWQTVGSLPYYYSGSVSGETRAYITSDMAAQFFGPYGYKATDAPGYQFGYSYNDIYKIYYYSNANYCMDISGGNVVDKAVVQLWTSNKTDAQVFRIWGAGNGYAYITPIGNSGYFVNIYGGNPADGTKLYLSSSDNEYSQWKMKSESNGTSFWSKADQNYCIDLPSGKTEQGNQLQIWTNGGNRYWRLAQQYRVSNNTVSEQTADGTYKIGLTAESNGDIVCYYLPGVTSASYSNAAESALTPASSCWDVTVRDDLHLVYSDGELSTMRQTVVNGGTATVKVENANGVLWSCVGKNGKALDVTSSQKDGYTTFTITNITQPVEVIATGTNPNFTVQYYARIPRFATNGDTPLKVIDTSAGSNSGTATLPTNGGSMATRNIYLEATGNSTTQNAGDATQLYRVKTILELTKMYEDAQFEYEKSPGLAYFNKLKENESYSLTRVGVLKDGKDPSNTNDDDWEWHQVENGNIQFTNLASEANNTTILITDKTVLRLEFNTTVGDYYNGTTFYDYNISSGQNADGRWRTGITGINSESNYGDSSNNQRTWRSGCDIFAFGNANCGTGMSGYLFGGCTLNKYDHNKNENYNGATFGLVQGLNGDGTIRYSDWLVVPKLFNEGDAQSKQTYTESSLTFDRMGDTYTLSAATLNNSNGQSNTLSGLQYFFNPSPYSGKVYSHIFTNNFWPLDPAAGRTDGLWGKHESPGSFQGFVESNNYDWGALAANFPASDDGNAHNWFFGMNFAISFNLTADYVGPLEYYFFGDDDLWVFLDNQLVCDIGGVHSSIGEYVNLRDYLPNGSSGQHTLSFFYTERGASGSTCYMSFTLPSVSSATTARDTGSLQIAKSVENTNGVDYSGEEYKFKVDLQTSEDGSGLGQTFSYTCTDAKGVDSYGIVKSGQTITLHAGETATINGIPAGTFYRVTEISHDGYQVTVNGSEGYIVSGTIETGATKPASFVNRPYHELPNSGGAGTTLYTIGGLALVLGAGILLYIHTKRRKEDVASS